jgi:hypothetical protein
MAQRPIEQDDQRAEQVDRILARLRTTLNEESRHVLDLLDAHPGRLTYDDSFKFWNRFKSVTKRAVAIATLIIIVSISTAILTAPPQAQAAISRGWRELRAGLRASYLRAFDFGKPEAYYTPGVVRLSAKQYAFTITARPSFALPLVMSKEAHAEVVAYPKEALRVRMSVSAREQFRKDDTKYYINFGDDPAFQGDTYKMIAVGPSALAEHVFPRAGTYVMRVSVVVKSVPRQSSDGVLYSTAEFVNITLHVGEAASPRN